MRIYGSEVVLHHCPCSAGVVQLWGTELSLGLKRLVLQQQTVLTAETVKITTLRPGVGRWKDPSCDGLRRLLVTVLTAARLGAFSLGPAPHCKVMIVLSATVQMDAVNIPLKARADFLSRSAPPSCLAQL